MQETRRFILEILRRRRQATVDEIVDELHKRRGTITAVTVRHHLKLLQEEELITSPDLKRRTSPGRPQYVYTLTDKARDQFPNNYQRLAEGLLEQLQKHLPPAGVNVILEGVADEMAQQACIPGGDIIERLDAAVDYLSERGYDAYWDHSDDGYVLYTSNCPYHQMSEHNTTLCEMDLRLVSSLLSVVPRRITHVIEGDETCSYLIPTEKLSAN
jgi:predicted ArsR family transcriptional regulator